MLCYHQHGQPKGLDYIFMHDNALCHTAHIITEWMAENVLCSHHAHSPSIEDYIERTMFHQQH